MWLVLSLGGIFWVLLQAGFVEISGNNGGNLDTPYEHVNDSPSLHGKKLPAKRQPTNQNADFQYGHSQYSQGELLAKRLQAKCYIYLRELPRTPAVFPVTTDSKHNLMFCPMCKLASTYWTRFFKLIALQDKNKTIETPYDIPLSIARPTAERLKITRGISGTLVNNYYKFMFVRDPYARILSAYVDKLFAPNPTFWRGHCRGIIKVFRSPSKSRSTCGSDLTFEEYVRAIVQAHQKPFEIGRTDCHDSSFMGSCHPCEVQYDFIGKMENFTADSYFLYEKFNFTRTLNLLKTKGKQLADDDALFDTVNSPFNWKEDIKSCIPWMEALKRIWRKLQIRGVIGKQQFPLTKEECDKISRDEFIALVKETQKMTPYSNRKKQRTEALIEIFSQVHPKYLQLLKSSYANDFHFFEYNDSPTEIFNINRSTIQYYGYLDIS